MKIFFYLIIFKTCLLCAAEAQEKPIVTLSFRNTANGKAIVKGETSYKNSSGEEYTVSKLKYYISHPFLQGKSETQNEGYYLIDEGKRNSIQMNMDPGQYNRIGFLLGIDSIRHCSGAQDGDLDPLMDMFWTWNSGYVIFKLEGYSASSSADLGRIEHHIGGYKAGNNVSTPVLLDLPQTLILRPGDQKEIIIEMNLDKYWSSSTEMSIREYPIITRPGGEAVKAAGNFKNLFSVPSLP